MRDSRLKEFHKLSPDERLEVLADVAGLDVEELRVLGDGCALNIHVADHMIENVVGTLPLPLGLGANLRVNGRDRITLMAIEEPSVVAALSHGAKLLRNGEGIRVELGKPWMVGQIQVLDVPDPVKAERALMDEKGRLLALADAQDPLLVEAGGGAREIEVRHLAPAGPDDPVGPMMVVHLTVDVRDAMGANAVNTMAEALAPEVAGLTGGRVRLRILTNLADRRLVVASGHVPVELLDGHGYEGVDVARGIVEASVFAERDPYRAATNNKGIMNGIDAVLLAAGQDFRAVEAGAHAYAARIGPYTSLSRWRLAGETLTGVLELPLAVGVVGGVTGVHPVVRLAHKIMEIESAADLAELAAAVGLAQNLAALRALAAEGIQHGHMILHARNLAMAAGALDCEVDRVVDWMVQHHCTDARGAAQALETLRSAKP